MYPETILKTICDDREHPEMILTELFQGKYRVHDSFWDGTKYQSQTVGARYGYKSLSAAQKVHYRQVGIVKESYARVQAIRKSTAVLVASLTPQVAPVKPRLRIAAIARQIA